MHIHLETYEDGCRLIVDGVERETADREINIEDFFPLLRELGATVNAVQYETWLRDLTLTEDMPNPASGLVFS